MDDSKVVRVSEDITLRQDAYILFYIKNALTYPQRARTPSVMDYWKPLAEDMDASAGIEPEFHHKNNRARMNTYSFSVQVLTSLGTSVYCWKGLCFSARQDFEGFSRFTDHVIEGVIPPELLADVCLKFHARPSEKAKRAKKEEDSKGAQIQPDDGQVAVATTAETDGGSSDEQEDGAIPMV